ncbi:PIN2/TERF1-interacting telomerase inhibitor 1 [Oryzias melastigma]|uniref:PIN2 (TERF1) interacting telomerase inhibitor 1 n=2 Tax=Oryzias melastigma TaxID=30732 RepID=A0A3B3DMQ1_ORYME|nr:PIN2/TERF1-interacting telomerase inhibitor 1 [Oryzias melastigma]
MSMLAEPRRKQKWSVDPRNSTWSKDDSKFGQKMLERMGWSKGKGLGRSEQGSTEHIKVKLKNNNHGLGASASHEDNWIAHQDDFNELLAQLNSHHGQTPSSEAPSEEKKSFSLEEKSKTSKKRVHYMKFTKGKDLSSRSETDLNCIFGKRSRLEKDQEQESSSSASQSEIEENGTSSAVELDTESITKTVTSTLTMQEYFAQRMAQLKKNRGNHSAVLPANSETQEELTAGHTDDAAEEPKKKKKKKKKNKELVEEVVDEESSSSVVIKDKENQERKGSRKRKTEGLNDTDEKDGSADVELNSEHLSSSKKKKSKKNKKEEPINSCDSPESVEIVQTKEQDCLVIESEAEQVEKKSKKKKRKRQNQD